MYNKLGKRLYDILKCGGKPQTDLVLILKYFNLKIIELDFIDKQKEIEILNFTTKYAKGDYPLQYLVGFEIFLGEKVLINEDVLIPRQETEELVDLVCKDIEDNYIANSEIHILDLCTGSGAIIIGINKRLKNRYNIKYTASDISKDALLIAEKNFKNLNIDVTVIESDIFKNIDKFQYDIITANPPYIDYCDTKIDENVKKYEPHLALFAEDNGLYIYKEILRDISYYINVNGKVYFEIGNEQNEKLIDYIHRLKYFNIVDIIKDMSDRNRIIRCFR